MGGVPPVTMIERSLSPQQRRAAELIGGQGYEQKDAAEAVETTARTVRRWLTDVPEFAALVRARREAALDTSPSARSVLEAGLNATTAKGEPDWPTRLKSAELLIRSSPKEAQEQARDVTYHPDLGENGDGPTEDESE